jgi:hypothetical protein
MAWRHVQRVGDIGERENLSEALVNHLKRPGRQWVSTISCLSGTQPSCIDQQQMYQGRCRLRIAQLPVGKLRLDSAEPSAPTSQCRRCELKSKGTAGGIRLLEGQHQRMGQPRLENIRRRRQAQLLGSEQKEPSGGLSDASQVMGSSRRQHPYLTSLDLLD